MSFLVWNSDDILFLNSPWHALSHSAHTGRACPLAMHQKLLKCCQHIAVLLVVVNEGCRAVLPDGQFRLCSGERGKLPTAAWGEQNIFRPTQIKHKALAVRRMINGRERDRREVLQFKSLTRDKHSSMNNSGYEVSLRRRSSVFSRVTQWISPSSGISNFWINFPSKNSCSTVFIVLWKRYYYFKHYLCNTVIVML